MLGAGPPGGAKAADETKPNPEDETINPLEVFRRPADLTARDGRLVLMEYIEEYPLLVSGAGMASRVRYYYRKRNPNDPTQPVVCYWTRPPKHGVPELCCCGEAVEEGHPGSSA